MASQCYFRIFFNFTNSKNKRQPSTLWESPAGSHPAGMLEADEGFDFGDGDGRDFSFFVNYI